MSFSEQVSHKRFGLHPGHSCGSLRILIVQDGFFCGWAVRAHFHVACWGLSNDFLTPSSVPT
jgi:hypothetical protein